MTEVYGMKIVFFARFAGNLGLTGVNFPTRCCFCAEKQGTSKYHPMVRRRAREVETV